MWNGTMFDDLDWPINGSRRFISDSWVSCYQFCRSRCLRRDVHVEASSVPGGSAPLTYTHMVARRRRRRHGQASLHVYSYCTRN